VRLAEKEFDNGHQTAGRRGSITNGFYAGPKKTKKNTKWIARFLKVLRQPAAKILDFFSHYFIIF